MTPAITPLTALSFLSTLSVFLLKTAVAYCCCWMLARAATSASRRFAVWFLYLTGTSAFWIYSIARLFLKPNAVPAAPSSIPHSPVGITWVVPAQLTLNLERLTTALLFLYVAVIVATACLGMWRRLQLRRVLHLRLAPSAPVMQVFRAVTEQMRLSSCDLWVLPGIPSPATLGFIHPALYLPADCDAQDETELSNVLRHELSHVKRFDSLWESLARLSRLLLFFHPLVHRAFAAIRFEREVACDMAVVRSCPDKRDLYAETLVRFGWKSTIADHPDYIGIGFTSTAAVLNARVRWILTGEDIYSAWSRKGRAAISAAVVWLFIAAAPALWVAFRLAPIPQATVISSLQQHAITAISRHTSSHSTPRFSAQSTPAPAPAAIVAPITIAPHTASDQPHYQVQNADEPMWNPVASDDSQSDQSLSQKAGPGVGTRPAGPSAATVILNTATELGRMGLGHDHDHD
jgi:beta-lactamase regulating signal transducer with metallopeptidase domain